MIKIQLSSSGSAIRKEEQLDSLRENCQNTEFFLVRIFPHSDCIRIDTPYLSVFSPNAEKYGPEKTPYLDTFHAEIVTGRLSLLDNWNWKKNFWSNYFLYFFNMLVFTLVSVLLFCVVAKAVVLLFFKAIQEAGGFA